MIVIFSSGAVSASGSAGAGGGASVASGASTGEARPSNDRLGSRRLGRKRLQTHGRLADWLGLGGFDGRRFHDRLGHGRLGRSRLTQGRLDHWFGLGRRRRRSAVIGDAGGSAAIGSAGASARRAPPPVRPRQRHGLRLERGHDLILADRIRSPALMRCSSAITLGVIHERAGGGEVLQDEEIPVAPDLAMAGRDRVLRVGQVPVAIPGPAGTAVSPSIRYWAVMPSSRTSALRIVRRRIMKRPISRKSRRSCAVCDQGSKPCYQPQPPLLATESALR